jgi:hypothetical protein
LTTGRVSESESLGRQSVCLGVEPTLWTFGQILLPFQEFGSGICCPISVGPLSDERPGLSFVNSVSCKEIRVVLTVCFKTLDEH